MNLTHSNYDFEGAYTFDARREAREVESEIDHIEAGIMSKASVTIYWDRQGDPEGWAYEIHNSERFDSGPLDIEGQDVGKREAFDAFLSEVPSWYAEEDIPAYEDFRSLTHDGPGWEARGAK